MGDAFITLQPQPKPDRHIYNENKEILMSFHTLFLILAQILYINSLITLHHDIKHYSGRDELQIVDLSFKATSLKQNQEAVENTI